jgi:N-acetylneuraminic acid mutarotase
MKSKILLAIVLALVSVCFALDTIWVDGTDEAELPALKTHNTWEPAQRQRHQYWSSNTAYGSKFYIFGGFRYDQEAMNDLWRYDYTNTSRLNGTWTLVGQKPANYGVKGVPSPDNWPPARNSGLNWADKKGNLYLFGGLGTDLSGKKGTFGDMWKFDGNVWTWIHGEKDVNILGVYGATGEPSPDNRLGARALSVTWVTSKQKVYIYGGIGFAMNPADAPVNLGDLWEYDMEKNVLTWLQRQDSLRQFATPDPYVYGSKGVSDTKNVPSSRKRSCGFVDLNDDLWLFGGKQLLETSFESLSDMWKFSGGNWTWMAGDNTVEQSGSYGRVGLPAVSNKPGARDSAFCWSDQKGALWLFGGYGKATARNSGRLNDFWLYNTKTNGWIWVGGANEHNNAGLFSGKFTKGAYPSSRDQGAYFLDYRNDMWIFGGNGFDKNKDEGSLGDVWKFVNPGVPAEPFVWTNNLIILMIVLFLMAMIVLSGVVFFGSYVALFRYEYFSQNIINDEQGETLDERKPLYDDI